MMALETNIRRTPVLLTVDSDRANGLGPSPGVSKYLDPGHHATGFFAMCRSSASVEKNQPIRGWRESSDNDTPSPPKGPGMKQVRVIDGVVRSKDVLTQFKHLTAVLRKRTRNDR